MILPIFVSIYFQNKTLVRQFTAKKNELIQERKIEKLFLEQPDGVLILNKVKKTAKPPTSSQASTADSAN